MTTRTLRRTLFALSLAAVLALLPAVAQAAPAGATRTFGETSALTGGPFVSWIWTALQAIWGNEGPSLDPNGLQSPSAPEGPELDPNGLGTGGDEGPSLDPNGLGAGGDEGPSLDPNG